MEQVQYLTEKQAAKYFQISVRSFGNWRREGKFQCGKEFIYVGKQIRYNINQLVKYFECSSTTN
ncbi:MAG: helix-turn-helix domain-containing protein [Flavobacteriales bacterium]|nr:helix-turn-helix domain-containing protein [Flavobacteriales bacterium]MBT5772680.1 helix-turn-helix domain-containing protein [Flavobacteriaceae bacterium]MBT6964617.1 helix-turn-helix domain-containing protein [Flavobacteriales bacterium]